MAGKKKAGAGFTKTVETIARRTSSVLAMPFGATQRKLKYQLVLFVFCYLLCYAAVFVPLPGIPLAAIIIGYVAVFVISVEWRNNEYARERYMKGLMVEGNNDSKRFDPNEQPDLRWLGIASSFQLLILTPLLFWRLQVNYQIFGLPEDTLYWSARLTLDSFTKSCFDFCEVYGLHVLKSDRTTIWGKHLFFVSHLMFTFALISAGWRFYRIHLVSKEAIECLSQFTRLPDGLWILRLDRRRCDKALRKAIQHRHERVRAGACEALARLYANGTDEEIKNVVELIIERFDDGERVQRRACEALKGINHRYVRLRLIHELAMGSSETPKRNGKRWSAKRCKCAAKILGDIGSRRALPRTARTKLRRIQRQLQQREPLHGAKKAALNAVNDAIQNIELHRSQRRAGDITTS